MKVLITNQSDLNKILHKYFKALSNRGARHVPAFALKADNSQVLYIHNNELHLSESLYDFLQHKGVNLDVLN